MTKIKTKQEYIDIIRKRCIEADESILDLVFGCEVEYKHATQTYDDGQTKGKIPLRAIAISLSKNKEHINLVTKSGKGSFQRYPFEGMKIIGHKIGIAEILVVVKKIIVSEVEWDVIIWKLIKCWKLKENDNIENQDLPTLKWLVDLLSK